MTDNTIASTPIGTGDTFAAKDIAGVKYPRNILTTPAGSDITPLSEGGAVSVSNFPATQAVSAASLPLPTGAATETTLAAVNTKLAGSLAVTGTFWQATQPVSIASMPSTPVTGTFWQATQPISAASLPAPADITASGSITTQNLVPAGTATAGSAVEIALSGQNALTVQTVGVYTGALSCQVTVDGNTWVTLTNSSCFYSATGTNQATIASAAQGVFTVNVAGWSKARITGLAAMTGSVAVSLRASLGGNVLTLGQSAASIGVVSLPTGSTLTNDVGVQYRATATGGATVAKILATASTNATCPKASAGRILGWALTNTSAAVKVVHFHNLATTPTVGTSVPAWSIVLPPNASNVFTCEGGIAMATGIAYSITGAIADLDTTATAANDVIGVLTYA